MSDQFPLHTPDTAPNDPKLADLYRFTCAVVETEGQARDEIAGFLAAG